MHCIIRPTVVHCFVDRLRLMYRNPWVVEILHYGLVTVWSVVVLGSDWQIGDYSQLRPRGRFFGSCLLQLACCGLQTYNLHVACCFLYCSCNTVFSRFFSAFFRHAYVDRRKCCQLSSIVDRSYAVYHTERPPLLATLYIEWSDVAVICGHYWVMFSGEYLSRCSNKI